MFSKQLKDYYMMTCLIFLQDAPSVSVKIRRRIFEIYNNNLCRMDGAIILRDYCYAFLGKKLFRQSRYVALHIATIAQYKQTDSP